MTYISALDQEPDRNAAQFGGGGKRTPALSPVFFQWVEAQHGCPPELGFGKETL